MVPRKQRHTARRVWERLVGEHGVQVGESTVRRFVAQVKAELAAGSLMVTVPQTHGLGAEAEVDFGEFYVWLDGTWTRLWMFVMRLSASGKAFHAVFGNECGESFYEGHNLAFTHFGGVPKTIRYDNLKAAVVKILLGRQRLENTKFVALRSHYGFDSFYCLPGVEGAHEKGGVEGEIGRFRRRWFVPVPRVASLDELNRLVAAADISDDVRVISGRPLIDGRRLSVGEHFAIEQPHLGALGDDGFEVAVDLLCRVDHKSRICVRQAYYSVPARLAGRKVAVRLGASRLEVLDGSKVVARHLRSTPGTPRIDDAHYPPRPAGPLNRQPKAANPVEAEFLALGEGARLWLIEAAAAGTGRIKVKMAEAVTLARLHGVERVDWALGHAATYERFAHGDLVSILTASPVGAQRRASETHSMQPSTRVWEHIGRGDDRR